MRSHLRPVHSWSARRGSSLIRSRRRLLGHLNGEVSYAARRCCSDRPSCPFVMRGEPGRGVLATRSPAPNATLGASSWLSVRSLVTLMPALDRRLLRASGARPPLPPLPRSWQSAVSSSSPCSRASRTCSRSRPSPTRSKRSRSGWTSCGTACVRSQRRSVHRPALELHPGWSALAQRPECRYATHPDADGRHPDRAAHVCPRTGAARAARGAARLDAARDICRAHSGEQPHRLVQLRHAPLHHGRPAGARARPPRRSAALAGAGRLPVGSRSRRTPRRRPYWWAAQWPCWRSVGAGSRARGPIWQGFSRWPATQT